MIVAKQHNTTQIFQKNLQQLSPWIRDSVLAIRKEELWKKIEVTYNDEGYPICKYKEENSSFHIVSKQPLHEAKRWCDSIPIKGAGAIFLYGSGFGYSLFELFSKKQPHTLVILFEQDIYIFTAMLHYFDLEPIIKTQKIAFLIGDYEYFSNAFDQLFFSIIFANCTNPVIAHTPISKRNFKEQYMKIHKHVFSQLGLFVFYIGNDHLDNLIGLDNLLGNIKVFIENPSLNCLRDKFKNIPAFIIANGPSLDKNMKQLHNIKNKGLIISTESAIIPLMKNGIKPDILTIVERSKYTYYYHFENNQYPDDISLICLGLIDKRVFPSFKGAKLPLFRKREAVNEWINQFIGDGCSIDAGANVSHLALELAVFLGADPIVFVGQDYAYGPDGVTHSKDALYLEEKGKMAREILNSKPKVLVEGNDGTMILSNQLWVDFKQGLERKIKNYKDKNIINATEGGAKIHGTINQKLAQVIAKYCKNEIPYRVNKIIEENKKNLPLNERIEGLKAFIDNVKKYSEWFYHLSLLSNKEKINCKQMIRLTKDGDVKYQKIIENTYQQNIAIFQQFISDDLYRCFFQQVIFVYFYLMNKVGYIDTPEKIIEIFSIQHDFFHHLNIISQSVSLHLEGSIVQLENILEEIS